MDLRLEIAREKDGRWRAEIPTLAGVLVLWTNPGRGNFENASTCIKGDCGTYRVW